MILFIDVIIAGRIFVGLALQIRRQFIHRHIDIQVVFSLPGNDQRRARFIDQDGVNFVDDGEVQPALEAILGVCRHIVAQIIETEFVVGTVSDVGVIGDLFVRMFHAGQDDANRQPKEFVQPAHPFGVACRQVIVHRHHMHALARQGIQVSRQRRHQRLAFAGAHFRDLAVMQHHAADQLHIEMAHLQGALAAFAHDGECFRQDRIERFTLLHALLEFRRFGTQLVVRQSGNLRFQRIDARDGLTVLFEQAVVTTAEYGLQYFGDHAVIFFFATNK